MRGAITKWWQSLPSNWLTNHISKHLKAATIVCRSTMARIYQETKKPDIKNKAEYSNN